MSELDNANSRMLRGAGRALAAIGDDLHGRSLPLVPLEEGTLRGSAEVAFLVGGARYLDREAAVEAAIHAGEGATMEVEVSYNTPYAAARLLIFTGPRLASPHVTRRRSLR